MTDGSAVAEGSSVADGSGVAEGSGVDEDSGVTEDSAAAGALSSSFMATVSGCFDTSISTPSDKSPGASANAPQSSARQSNSANDLKNFCISAPSTPEIQFISVIYFSYYITL